MTTIAQWTTCVLAPPFEPYGCVVGGGSQTSPTARMSRADSSRWSSGVISTRPRWLRCGSSAGPSTSTSTCTRGGVEGRSITCSVCATPCWPIGRVLPVEPAWLARDPGSLVLLLRGTRCHRPPRIPRAHRLAARRRAEDHPCRRQRAHPNAGPQGAPDSSHRIRARMGGRVGEPLGDRHTGQDQLASDVGPSFRPSRCLSG